MHEVWRQIRAAWKDDGSYSWSRRRHRNSWSSPSTIYQHWGSGWWKQVPLQQVGWFDFFLKLKNFFVIYLNTSTAFSAHWYFILIEPSIADFSCLCIIALFLTLSKWGSECLKIECIFQHLSGFSFLVNSEGKCVLKYDFKMLWLSLGKRTCKLHGHLAG